MCRSIIARRAGLAKLAPKPSDDAAICAIADGIIRDTNDPSRNAPTVAASVILLRSWVSSVTMHVAPRTGDARAAALGAHHTPALAPAATHLDASRGDRSNRRLLPH